MNLRFLGVACMFGAPFLALSLWFQPASNGAGISSWVSDGFGILYLLGWMCGVLGLREIGAMGNSRPKRVLYGVQLTTLALAVLSNFVEDIAPQSSFYKALDLSWPLSQLIFLVIALGVARYGKLAGWKRFAPLLCGLWFPSAMMWMAFLDKEASLIPAMIHATLAWFLLGWIVFSSAPTTHRQQLETI